MKKNAGVSMVEILIAMVIAGIALFTIAAIFPRIGSHGKAMSEADQARLLAAEVIEGLQLISFNDNTYNCDTFLNGGNSGANYISDVSGQNIGAVTYIVVPNEPNCGGDINTVDITIKWTKMSKDHSITVTGVIK